MQTKISRIYLASDHAGFDLKEIVKIFLQDIKNKNRSEDIVSNLDINFQIVDFGAYAHIDTDDYTEYMHKAGHDLSIDYNSNRNSVAIVFGGSGEGEAMVMNRYDGVRCTTYYGGDLEIIKLGRLHNDANALSFGARFISPEECIKGLEIFLNTEFEKGRHLVRVEKIDHKIGFLSRFFN
jgi:ribose 5-phosphate isomerase B